MRPMLVLVLALALFVFAATPTVEAHRVKCESGPNYDECILLCEVTHLATLPPHTCD